MNRVFWGIIAYNAVALTFCTASFRGSKVRVAIVSGRMASVGNMTCIVRVSTSSTVILRSSFSEKAIYLASYVGPKPVRAEYVFDIDFSVKP